MAEAVKLYPKAVDIIEDLIKGANDETESIAVVEELYRLAGIYNTCIVCSWAYIFTLPGFVLALMIAVAAGYCKRYGFKGTCRRNSY